MGYKVRADTINIRHPDHPGLLVVAESISFGRLAEFQRAAVRTDASDFEAMEQQGSEALAEFVGKVVSWNLEYEDGSPVPITVEGLLSVPSALLPMQLFRAWQGAMAAVDAPLPHASNSGDSLAEVPIPMVPLSSDRAS